MNDYPTESELEWFGYELKAEPQKIIKSTNQTEAFCL